VTIGPIRWPHAALLVPSALAWILLSGSAIPGLPDFCGPGGHSAAATIAGMAIALRLNPIGPMLLSWLLMLCAMMLPLLGRPIGEVGALGDSRFRRGLAVLAFLCSYAAVWLAVLLLLAVATAGLRLATIAAPLIALGIAIAWQMTPIKARCLRLCRAPLKAGPGLGPELRGLCHGAATARACVGSGWALMALPFLFETGHFGVMALTAFVMAWERSGAEKQASASFRWRRAALE
jgi:predicted metal-binding membrane protein